MQESWMEETDGGWPLPTDGRPTGDGEPAVKGCPAATAPRGYVDRPTDGRPERPAASTE